MEIKRIDLSKEIEDWRSAVYGEEVRSANISALQKVQKSVNDTVVNVNQAANDIQKVAGETEQVAAGAEAAVESANNTINHANNILIEAEKQVEYAAKNAKLAESWAVGGTGERSGEDGNCSEFFSKMAEAEYLRAKNEADRAESYANFVEPRFLIENNRLYMKADSTVKFILDGNQLYFKLPTSAI